MKKRVTRILRPFLFWSVVVFSVLYYQEGGRSALDYFQKLTYKVLTEGVHSIYWYIYMLLGLYFITPPIRIVIRYGGETLLGYMLFVVLAIFIIGNFCPEITVAGWLFFRSSIWLFYYLLGYYIVMHKDFLFNYSHIIYYISAMIISLFAIFRLYDIYYEGLNIISYISVFVIFLILPYKYQFKLVQEVSRMSYGIYLCHFIFISIFLRFDLFYRIPLIIEPLLMMVSVLVVSVALLKIFDKAKIKEMVM